MKSKFYFFVLSIFLLLTVSLKSQSTLTFTLNTNGSFTVPCGVTTMTVTCWGGGGGGGGSTSAFTAGSGGGGGGYSNATIPVTPAAIINYTVGVGGSGAPGAPGGAGGNTTFSVVIGNGGAGGGANMAAAGLGGTGSTGGFGTTTNGNTGISGGAVTGGNGGAAFLGGAGGSGSGMGSNGTIGGTPGGGGGGSGAISSPTLSGGIGGNGRIIISYLDPTPYITSQITPAQTICFGASFSPISVNAVGANLSYQWYSNNTPVTTTGTLIPGQTSPSYIPDGSIIGAKYYYCILSSPCGPNDTSNISGAMIVNPLPTPPTSVNKEFCAATSLNPAVGGCPGTSPNAFELTAASVVGSSNIDWYFGDPGSGGVFVSNSFGPNCRFFRTGALAAAPATPGTQGEARAAMIAGTTGQYSMWAVYSNASGCYSTPTEVRMLIRPSLTVPSAPTGTNNICNNTNAVIYSQVSAPPMMSIGVNTLTNPSAINIPTQYVWSSGTAGVSTATPNVQNPPFDFNIGVQPNPSQVVSIRTLLQYVTSTTSGSFCPTTNSTLNVTVFGTSVGGSITPATATLCSASTTGIMTLSGHKGTIIGWERNYNLGGYVAIPGTAGLTTFSEVPPSGPGTYNYRVVVQNGPCATAVSSSNTITVNSSPTLSLISSNISCLGNTDGSITASGVGGTSPYQFSLNGGGFFPGTNFTFAGLSAGSYTIAIQDAQGCSGTSQIENVTSPPALSFILGGNSTICSGNALGITITPSGGTGGYTYDWLTSPNANTTGESTTGVASALINDVVSNSTVNIESLTYTVSVTDANACVATNTVIATVFPTPTLTNALSGATCSGISFSQILTSSISPATFTWIASPNPNTTGESTILQTTNTLTEVVTNPTGSPENILYTIIPTVTATTCSGAPQTFTLTVRSLPVISAPNMNTCDGGVVTIPSTPSGGTPPYASYGWYTAATGGVFLSATQNYSTGALVAGSYQYFPQVSDNAGCVSARPLVTVTSFPNPTVSAGADQTICSGSTATITATGIGGTPAYNYAWYDAVTGGTLLASTQVYSPILPTGSYNNFAQVTDANGCVSPRDQMVLTVPNPLGGSLSSINISCFGANNGAISVTPFGGNGPYQFSLNGGAYQVPPSFTGLTAGTHTITIKDNINCTFILTATLTEPPLLTGVLLGSSPTTCNGSVDGSATITQAGGTGGYQYSLNGSPYGASNLFSLLAAGSYTATVQDANFCISGDVIFSITQPTPVSISSVGSTTVCSGVPLNISLSGIGGTPGYTFNWSSNDNGNTTGESLGAVTTSIISNTVTSTSTIPELLNYNVTITDINGCIANQIINVTIDPSPVMVSSPGFSVCSGTAMSFGLSSNIASTFSWLAADNANTTGESTTPQSTASISDMVLNPTLGAEPISYTVTPTSIAGSCIGGSQTVVANINPLPAVTISASTNPICFGDTTVLTGSGAFIYNWSGADLISTIGNPVMAIPTANTTYTVVGTNTMTACSNSSTLSVSVDLPPTASAAGTDQQLCATNTTVLSANAPVSGTGNWTIISGAGGSVVSPGNPTSVFNGVVGITYILRWTISNTSCPVSQDDVTISFKPSPGFTIVAPPTICAGDNLNLSVASLIGGTTFNYNWSGPGAFSSILPNPIRNAILGADGGTYSLNITNEFGCSTSNNTNITVLASPTAIISGGAGSSVCANEMATLDGSLSSANGDVITGYQWMQGGTTIGGATLNSYLTNLADFYKLEVTNSNGCTDTSLAHLLTIETIPTPIISGNASFCSGSSSLLDAFSSGAGGASVIDNYEWLFNGASVSSGPVNDTYLATMGGNYQLIVLNSNSCKDTTAALFLNEMFPPAPPTLTSTGTSYCLNDSLLISIQSPTVGHSYSWSVNPPDISISSPSSNVSSYVGGQITGPHTIEVIETDLSGCSSGTGSTSVTINPIPTATASSTNSDTLCYGGGVVLNLAPNSMTTYSWTSSFGATGSAQNDILSTATQTGPVEFYGSVTNTFGCQSTNDTLRFFVANPIIINVPSATIVDATCGQADGSISGIFISADGPLNYTWQNSGGSLGVNAPSINSVVADTYTLTVYNRFGCPNSGVFTINSGPAPASPTLQSAPTVCENQSFVLAVSSPIAGATYDWFGPSGFTQSGVNLDSITITNASALNAGPYTVTMTLGGCTSAPSAPISAVVNQMPIVSVSGSASFCVGSSTLLNAATTVGAASTYQWYLNGSIISGATSSSYATNMAGNYNVEIVLASGCVDSAATPTLVSVNPLPIVSISPGSTTICEGSSLTLLASGAATYTWSNSNTTASVSVSPAVSTSFSVQGIDTNGCVDTDTVFVSVNPKPLAPAASSSSAAECAGTSVTLNSSSSLTNTWYNVSTNASISNLQSFAHTETFAGSYSYGVYVTDANSCNSDTAYVSVLFNNCVSNLINEIEFLQANGSVSNNILTNDGNPAGFTVNTTPVQNPINGSFAINSSGSYTYTPNTGFSGYDIVVVSACNTTPVCLNDTIFISVGPNAVTDFGTVNSLVPNAQLTGNLLTNDAGTGIAGTVVLINGVNHGSLTITASGDFVYVPTPNYCGLDSFLYQISDVNSFVTSAYCIIDVSCTTTIVTHTGFSPNNDGVNDDWVIANIEANQNKVTIYDRWGNEIWVGENYNNNSVIWSGKNKNNEELIAGTYFYMIEIEGQKAIKGWVEITK